jgi:hypothetical protein
MAAVLILVRTFVAVKRMVFKGTVSRIFSFLPYNPPTHSAGLAVLKGSAVVFRMYFRLVIFSYINCVSAK